MLIKTLPPRLTKGKIWYIDFYQVHPDTSEIVRFRKTFQLNRIRDLNQREKHAMEILQLLSDKLRHGYPYTVTDLDGPSVTFKLLDGLDLAVKIKCTSDRENSNKSYRSIRNIFQKWVVKEKIDKLNLISFNESHAFKFMDHVVFDRNCSNRTFNNYLMFMKTMFNELISRGYIAKNVWKVIKKKREDGKGRAIIPDQEKKVIFDYILQTDPLFSLAVIFTYHCFIRPAELRRMKFNMINLKDGVITLPGIVTKNRDLSILTIPKSILPLLREYRIDERPGNLYVFGKNSKLGSTLEIGKDYFNKTFNRIQKELVNAKIIKKMNNVTFYSWKDTGVTTLIKNNVDIHQIMKQLRHSNLSVTQRYIQSVSNINESIRRLDSDLL